MTARNNAQVMLSCALGALLHDNEKFDSRMFNHHGIEPLKDCRFYVVIVDLILTRVVHAGLDHVPDGFEDESWLDDRIICIGLHQREVPFVKNGLGVERGVSGNQLLDTVYGASKFRRIVAV